MEKDLRWTRNEAATGTPLYFNNSKRILSREAQTEPQWQGLQATCPSLRTSPLINLNSYALKNWPRTQRFGWISTRKTILTCKSKSWAIMQTKMPFTARYPSSAASLSTLCARRTANSKTTMYFGSNMQTSASSSSLSRVLKSITQE